MTSKNANTIVIIDSDEDLLKILKISLESKGLHVHGITTGKNAMEYLNDENKLDDLALIITERLLPDCDGFDILKNIHAKYGYKIPVIILSAISAESEQLDGYKYGALDYIAKPFNLAILIKKIVAIIHRGNGN
jgi:DNA-binding response OmpR family regulator